MEMSFVTDSFKRAFIIIISVTCLLLAFKIVTLTDLTLSSTKSFGEPDSTTQGSTLDTESYTSNNKFRERKEQKEDDTKFQILLLTYGRSGSTFTSELINHPEEVFYYFEPLNYLQEREPTAKYWLNSHDDLSLESLRAAFACNFSTQTKDMLDDGHLRKSDSTKNFYYCLHNKVQSGLTHLECFLKLIQDCKQHRVTFAKTIRLEMKLAQSLLEEYPNLRLLYLIRDPRATLHSQARVFKRFSLTADIGKVSKTHCLRLGEDVAVFSKLKRMFPDRVKALRYENGAMDPQGYTKEIYEFLGFNVTPEVKNFVTSLTSAKPAPKPAKKNSLPGPPAKQSKLTKILNDTWDTIDKSLAKSTTGVTSSAEGLDRTVKFSKAVSTQNPVNSSVSALAVKSRRKRDGVYAYSTHRDNPKTAMEKWRYDTGLKQVKTIDAACDHLYDTLGYRTVETQKELEDTVNIPLTVKPKDNGIFD